MATAPTRSRFVTIDLETRSACDLRAHGGHLYAEHPTTRLLTVAWHVDGEYHVWLPGVEKAPAALLAQHLGGVHVHLGSTPPPIPTDRPWVGHNAFGFDELVWARHGHAQPPRWIDSMCLANAAGLPAGLQHIGERLWGEGKYKEGSRELQRASRATSINDCDPVDVPVGSAVLVARYNVQDVRLTVDLMDELDASLHMTRHELRVLAAHREINNRGVRVDVGLVSALHRLSNEAVADCVRLIAEETLDPATGVSFFPDEDSLRKRTRVLEWVKSLGVDFGESLRREVVNQFIESVKGEMEEQREDTDDEGDPVGDTRNLALVCRVLSLRQSALRITAAKLEAAGNRVDHRGVARALFAYWSALTGRWAGRGIQVQNLPRPKEAVPCWPLVREFRRTGRLDLSRVRAYLAADHRRANVKRAKDKQPPMRHPATADDAASGLIRSLFIPHEGHSCLLAADLAAIEARVLNWLAGSQWMLDIFAAGGDPYIEFCRKVTGETIKKKDPRRQVWKVILLGAGYQLGEDKLAVYCASQGVDLTVAGLTPRTAIDAYRDAHPEIAGVTQGVFDGGRKWRTGGLWNDLNTAAVEVVTNGGSVTAGRCEFYRDRGHLYVKLPSGREVCYRNARIVPTVKWGKERPQVVYASPRWRNTALYGGKLCWGGDTLVLTRRGAVPIRSVTAADELWDGVEWVKSDGAVHNGTREVGTWLGQSVTAGHLIYDGKSWHDVTRLDASSTTRCLAFGRDSAPSSYSTWTGGTTTDTTNPETFVWSRGETTAPTDVYDVLNCGPRNRYTVVTPYGPVVAHNCENLTQAVASDFIRHALVLMRDAGVATVLHVHDEIVASGHPEQLPDFMRMMTTVPDWAPGFPLEAEGGWIPRYAKAPPKGSRWREQVWRDGVRVK